MDKGLGHTFWVPVYDKRTGNKFVRRVKYVEFCQVTYFHMQIVLHSYCSTEPPPPDLKTQRWLCISGTNCPEIKNLDRCEVLACSHIQSFRLQNTSKL